MPCTSPAPAAQLITSQMQSCGRCRQRRGGVMGSRGQELEEQLAQPRREQIARQMPRHPVFIGTGYQYRRGPSRPSPGPAPSKGQPRAHGRGRGAGWVWGILPTISGCPGPRGAAALHCPGCSTRGPGTTASTQGASLLGWETAP